MDLMGDRENFSDGPIVANHVLYVFPFHNEMYILYVMDGGMDSLWCDASLG